MKITKKLITLILIAYLIVPMISFALAAKEDYVGIDEGDEYIWEATYDEDVVEDAEKDLSMNFNSDLKGVKIEIKDIGSEDEIFGYDGVKIEVKKWTTEKSIDKKDWDETSATSTTIYKYDDDIYPLFVSLGIYFIGTDVDWDDLQKKMNDNYDDDDSLEEGKAEVVWNSGIKSTLKFEDKDIEEVQYTTIFNTKGVLSSYTFSYGGKNCFTLSLQGIDKYITMQTIMIGAIALIAIIGIVVVIVLVKRHR